MNFAFKIVFAIEIEMYTFHIKLIFNTYTHKK